MIQVMDRAVNILNEFSETQPFRTIEQISRSLNLPRSTVYRILESLKENHFIERTEVPGKYRLGYQIMHLAASLHKSYDIAAIARPYIEKLKTRFNETIQLQVLSENQYGIYIIVEECEDPLRVTFPQCSSWATQCLCTQVLPSKRCLRIFPLKNKKRPFPKRSTPSGRTALLREKRLMKS